ncbi:hypothetical protein NFI96_021717 [Prochilodus magdalenae]|nr:hypothetical protein NFI96_021717 [Prochilodus magdalenae]
MKADLEAPVLAGSGSAAIQCRDVCRSYGKLKVLSSLNLTVPQGQIYGLLGPSGCGKTTLLKCIVGTLKISRGYISVLGKPPAFPGHEVPGRMVGYMPQDIALYNEFTISNTLWFYGRIHGLSSKETEDRMNFLIDFLDLPQKNSLVRNLSGGQRRRVSLGAALLQNPQLLILDEPTVGVDPVLRAKIWQHLVEIVRGGQVSVIITTHYIEEARQANTVGLMRNGRLLAEAKPEEVMKEHNALTLESAFLQLCEDSDQVGSKDSPQGPTHTNSPSPDSLKDESRELLGKKLPAAADIPKPKADWKVKARHVIPKWRNIAALTIKTMVRMRRNPGSLCFQFLLPVIQICLMCLCIGADPKGIEVAVVNNETSSSAYSRTLLSFLDNTSIIQVNLSHKAAFDGIYNGEYWGVIEFGQNFTSYLTKSLSFLFKFSSSALNCTCDTLQPQLLVQVFQFHLKLCTCDTLQPQLLVQVFQFHLKLCTCDTLQPQLLVQVFQFHLKLCTCDTLQPQLLVQVFQFHLKLRTCDTDTLQPQLLVQVFQFHLKLRTCDTLQPQLLVQVFQFHLKLCTCDTLQPQLLVQVFQFHLKLCTCDTLQPQLLVQVFQFHLKLCTCDTLQPQLLVQVFQFHLKLCTCDTLQPQLLVQDDKAQDWKLDSRMLQPRVSKEIIDGGSVHVWLDLTNRQIAVMLQKKLHEAFQAFVDSKLGSLAYLVSFPIKFEEPVYGSQNTDFTTFVTPGAVLSITFYLAVGLTALSFVLERKEGLMDRCWVAGVSSLETMLAHLFSQLLVISVQIILLLVFILLVFKIPNEGSLALVVTLIVLQGITGISFGLVISSAIDDEQSANQAALGIFYPNLIISGVIWPVECIPYPLRYLSLVLPQTYASEALRCIMYRGWGLSRMMVWRGFAVTLGWNTFFLILATIILKLRT